MGYVGPMLTCAVDVGATHIGATHIGATYTVLRH